MNPLSNRRRKEIGKLSRKKYRRAQQETIVEGLRSVEAAVDAGAEVREVLVAESLTGRSRLNELAERAVVPLHEVDEETMGRFSDVETPPGVLAVVVARFASPERLAEVDRVLMLDGVGDPGNAGTILRTAAWFGVELVVAGRGTVDLFHPKVMRAGMGAHWDLDLLEVDDLAQLLSTFRDDGGCAYGADMEGEAADRWSPPAPSALVLGSEAHGLSQPVAGMLEGTVSLPSAAGRRGVESLNVAMAGSILLYEWTRRR